MKILTGIITSIFLFVAIFGFAVFCVDTEVAAAVMNHSGMSDGAMDADMGMVATDGVPMVVHHVSAYQSFSNTLISSLFFIVVSLCVSVLFFAFQIDILLRGLSAFILNSERRQKRRRLFFPASKKITRWLSLFENSPSFA